MRKNSWKTPLAVLVAFSTIAITGCGASGGDGSNGTGDGETNPDARLSVAVQAAVTQWDPAENLGGPETAALKMVYDTLVDADVDNNPMPRLAESWTQADDKLSFTFTLRDDATFTDGTPVTAEAVKASLDRNRAEGSRIASTMTNIDSIEAVDETTLVIHQIAPDTTLPISLSDRAGMVIAPSSYASGDVTEPVGSGPFEFVSEQQGIELVLDRNDDYWDDDYAQVTGVDFEIMEDAAARLNAAKSGAVDMTLVGGELLTEGEVISGYDQFAIKGRALRNITINPDLLEPLQDQRVRLAMNMAIDREAIASGVLFGNGEAAYQVRPDGAVGYIDEVEGIPFDPEEAKDLLDEAGYGDGFSFTFVAQPKFQKEAEAVQDYWQAIGIDTDISVLAGTSAAQAVWYDKTEAVGMLNFDGRLDPAIAYDALYSENINYNPGNLTDPALTKLIDDGYAAETEEARNEIFAEAAELLTENPLGAWPVVYGYDIILYKSDLVGVEPFQSGFPVVKGIGKP